MTPIPLVTHDPWPLMPDKCPADLHFIDWLNQQARPGGREVARELYWHILHMGPGQHHLVGRQAWRIGSGFAVTAITNSPGEVESYVRLAAADADLARHYHVLFDDIYQLRPQCLPVAWVATLFHLGEADDDRRLRYASLDIRFVIETVLSQLVGAGRLLFYTGSSAWDRVEPVVKLMASDFDPDEQTLQLDEDFKTLRVYRHMK